MKKKIYAVMMPSGKERIFTSWAACSRLVIGKPNVFYKSFKDLEEAMIWADSLRKNIHFKKNFYKQVRKQRYFIFVDGSFSAEKNAAGWGMVVIKDRRILKKDKGVVPWKNYSHNIEGELYASIKAIEWSQENDKEVVIVYDYQGVEAWALGVWETKSEVAKKYLAAIKGKLKNVRFKKVKAHTGIKYNELADQLAKEALKIK